MSRFPEELPLSGQKPVDEDVRQELLDHIERRTAELIAGGMSASAARAEAERAFGDITTVSAECRDITTKARKSHRRVERLDGLAQDLRFAIRLLRRSPTFAIVAIATLALGVGANSAIFSLIDSVLLRPLPYDHPAQLADVVELHKKGWAHPSYANFVDLHAQSHTFQSLAGYYSGTSTILGGDQPMRINAAWITSDFFRTMRVRPEVGRLTTAADHHLGALPVVVVSDRFWRNHLGANADLASLRLRGDFNFQVVGVLPPGFDFPGEVDVWQPIELQEQPVSRTAHGLSVTGRLQDGVTLTAAQHELDLIMQRVGETAGLDFDAVGTKVTSLQDDLTGSARKPLMLLLAASVLLLLTACTNLASTLLARGTARAQELAVRTAIGAGRLRVIRQIFTESLVIAIAGCTAGLLLAEALLRGVAAVAPPSLGLVQGVHLDLRVLAFTAGIAVVTAMLFGFLPALRLTDVDTGALMHSGTRGGSVRRGGVWSALVVIEVALAVVLLIGSGLLLHSFARITNVNLGFDPEHVLTVAIDLPQQNYPDVARAVVFHDRALEALRAIPGVQFAGVTNVLPTEGSGPDGGMEAEGKPRTNPAYPSTGYGTYRLASTGYFAAMKMKILRGRDFAESDGPSSLPVIVVNRALAEKEWPGEDPLGKRMRPSGMDATVPPFATVIGVVDNVPGWTAIGPSPETYYYSYRQLPNRARSLTAVIRSTLPPAVLANAVRKTLGNVDPLAPMEFRPLNDLVASSVSDRRFMALLLGLFATVALLLAAVGIYGVVTYSVAQRTREIGIRIALGATPVSVGRMVQVGAMGVVLVGTVVGVGAAFAATRLLQSLLYEVTATDPLAFGGVVVLLIATAWLASWAPARRSTHIDPIVAIRAE
jgi:putative ABC transport system permease protein